MLTVGCTIIFGLVCMTNPLYGQGVQDVESSIENAPFPLSGSLATAGIGDSEAPPVSETVSVDLTFPSEIETKETHVPLYGEGEGRVPLFSYWDHGLRFVSEGNQFNLHVGGNLQWDSVWLNGSDNVLGVPGSNATSTTNSGASLLRRGRVRFDGNIYEAFDYSLEFDLANAVNENKGQQNPTQDNVTGSPLPCNIWVQLRNVPFFNRVRIGNQVKPIGMTNNTYQGFLPFMERADNMDGFYGPFDEGFDPGISSINSSESELITWRYGVFRPLKNAFGIGINNYTVSGRVTALPIFEDDGVRLLHIGFSSSQGSLVNNEFRIRARPALRNGPGYAIPVIADTSTLPGRSQFLIGPELAAVLGPWTFQAEWTGQFFTDAVAANGQAQGTAFFHGGYAQILYFLTGEHQAYERKEGVFGRVVPHNSVRFGQGHGGAWQLGAHFSYLDLNDKAINGGQISDMTIGLNWFLNPNMKIQGNYLLTHRDSQQGQGDGWFNGLGMRVACDF
jgi:phosphate-selective porin OprO/OprP